MPDLAPDDAENLLCHFGKRAGLELKENVLLSVLKEAEITGDHITGRILSDFFVVNKHLI